VIELYSSSKNLRDRARSSGIILGTVIVLEKTEGRVDDAKQMGRMRHPGFVIIIE